jgi:DNA polymerase I-like protein with 3'-5' exonuclease and polymerase domains/predicted P-loop ATPase
MDAADITAENVAKAVGGKVEGDGSILCCCPIHEASGRHNASLVLSITDERRILFHCRSQNCDATHFQAIRGHLIKCGLPGSHVGGNRADKEIRYNYQHLDGTYAWTKTRFATKAGKKRFRCEVWDEATKQWSAGRPEGVPLLFNLAAVARVLAAYPATPLLIVEGERDVLTAGELGALATSGADGASKWRVEDTQKLIELGVRKVVVCPDNDGPGIEHGIRVAKTFQQVGVEVRWLELPGLGSKGDLSDWAPNQTNPHALLAELIGAAPLFDADALDWRSRLKVARPNAGCSYRGDIPNMSLALQYEPRLKGCFAWNDFRYRVEVIRKTPWCMPEWWEPANLTPVGHRALRDTDISELGNYLTKIYDFGACPVAASRVAIHGVADRHIFDELTDCWIDALPNWDSVARLDGWLATYGGADTEAHSAEYLALIGAKYVMQVLHRALHPGAKADYSLIFTSAQGVGKDRVLEAMFAPYYREGIPSPGRNPADFARGIAGAIVAHGAEMSAWRKSDVEEQKAVLTRCVDTDRPAYGVEVRSYPRRTCLAFTTNDVEFLQDATGNRRYWVVSVIRDRIDIEWLSRDRNQILAEALQRLKDGEQHWPTPEEEERLIVPERQKNMPEVALEIIDILERFIVEKPQTTRPNRGDFAWKWERRPQPLGELYLDEFFEQCFGMYAAIRRQGLDRASKKDIAYCTTWLRENSWRRVEKRRPDGQRRCVWRAAGGGNDRHPSPTQASELGSDLAEKAGSADAADVADGVADDVADGVADVEGNILSQNAAKSDPTDPRKYSKIGIKSFPNNNLQLVRPKKTFRSQSCGEKIDEEGGEDFYFQIGLGKVGLGRTALDGLLPATPDDLEEHFPRDRFLALDVETTGLFAARDGLRTVQIADGESAAMMVFDRPVPARALVVLADFLRGRRVVAHNARFEASWLREAGIDLVLDDTILLFSAVRGTRLPKGSKFIGGGSSRVSLAALAVMVLGETLDKSQQVSDWAAPELSAPQLAYALNDAIVTHRVWEALRAELHRKSKQHGVDIAAGYEDLRFSAAMAHTMERAGIGFDTAAHRAWIVRKQEPVAAIEAHLATCDPALTPACIASGVQLDRLFRQRLEFYPDEKRRPALLAWPKTEKARRLAFGCEDLETVLTAGRLQPAERWLVQALYARAEQARGLATFGEPFSSRVVDGRLYGQLHAGGAVTGRYTSTDPNLQNIPTDPEFRGFFRAPEGRVLVDVDYSQLELRVFAARSGDAKMIAAFEDGWDYHDLIVQRLGCTRRQAKAINFGIIFGMGVGTLAAELGVDDVTASEYLRGWDEQAPAGAEWRSSLPRLYAAEQGVRTARRWIDYLDDDDADAAANTRPMNYPVQGGAADVMHRAMRLLFERYRDWPGDVLPVLTVHDEILVEADIAVADQVGSLLADVMVEAFRDVLPNGPTRFLAIPGVGPTWAAAKADGETREKALRQASSREG